MKKNLLLKADELIGLQKALKEQESKVELLGISTGDERARLESDQSNLNTLCQKLKADNESLLYTVDGLKAEIENESIKHREEFSASKQKEIELITAIENLKVELNNQSLIVGGELRNLQEELMEKQKDETVFIKKIQDLEEKLAMETREKMSIQTKFTDLSEEVQKFYAELQGEKSESPSASPPQTQTEDTEPRSQPEVKGSSIFSGLLQVSRGLVSGSYGAIMNNLPKKIHIY